MAFSGILPNISIFGWFWSTDTNKGGRAGQNISVRTTQSMGKIDMWVAPNFVETPQDLWHSMGRVLSFSDFELSVSSIIDILKLLNDNFVHPFPFSAKIILSLTI